VPTPDNFAVETVAVGPPGPGEVVVANHYFALEPGARLAMDAISAGVPGFDVPGLRAHSLGAVVDPGASEFAVDDLVLHDYGWREFAVVPAERVRRVRPDALPSPTAHLSGGLTAYVGLTEIAGLRSGETVFVSSAAGQVGGLAGQFARLLGAGRVVGSAGGPEKTRYARTELGFDEVIDYRDGALVDRLRAAAPDGVDVYFDNVGGATLEAALEVMNPHGRVVLCGALAAQSSAAPPPGPANLIRAVAARLTLRGFTVNEYLDRAPEFTARLDRWLRSGQVRYRENILDGVESAATAFVDVLTGRYVGRTLVRLRPKTSDDRAAVEHHNE
jgi:NADPH-dependent curcumin reductase CurA